MKVIKMLAVFAAVETVLGNCNPEYHERQAQYANQQRLSDPGAGKVANLTLLPQDKGNMSPAALDGSPYGFYFSPSKSGSTKWSFTIRGGGWCYDEVDCACRANTSLGSSTQYAPMGSCMCVNVNDSGTGYDGDCNCVELNYLDGASFSGYRADPVSIPNSTQKIYMRGIKNLDGVIDFAMANGMTKATQFVVNGGSAGGLSTFLHADRIAARVKAEAPSCDTVRAMPIVGYFLDHDNFQHTTGFPGGPNSPQWAHPGTGANYTMWMKYIYTMQNLTFGADGGLTESCQLKHADEPHLCFMSPHMQDVIETPFFMLNSKYDAWQLANEFQSSWATKAEQEGVLQYGKDFMNQVAPVYMGGETKNGGMITSCICHGCPWEALELDGKNTDDHFFDWFTGKTTGADSFHVDPRLPNGGGALNGTAFKQCAHFPIQQ
eukprot:m.261103 g.261103  ORF g.261103 m.261103 type:complete len:434 (-) comp41304_c0_seq1:368-1669(-)